MHYLAVCAIGLVLGLAGCRGADVAVPTVSPGGGSMELTSTAFVEGQGIPQKYTCDGDDASPPLAWTGAPAGTAAFALIADDPDAPMGTWVHWVLFDLPGDLAGLPEGVAKAPRLPTGGVHGNNSWPRAEYGGPCPPKGTHRYYFKLYALDQVLGLAPGASADDVRTAMEGHVLSEAELMGRYAR